MGSYTNVNTTRYPDYLESKHQTLLDYTQAEVLEGVATKSPAYGRTDIEIDDLFFDVGSVIGNFPSLFDIYGKFLAGLDISVLFDQILYDTTNGIPLTSLVEKKVSLINTEVDNSIVRFNSGVDNINSIMNSIYIDGINLINESKDKTIDRYKTEVKYKLLPIAINRWSTHLSWNKNVVGQYSNIVKLYYNLKLDVINTNLDMNIQDKLWPLDLYEFERSVLGLLTGAGSSSTSGKKGGSASDLEKFVGGALSGAATGFGVGNWVGAIVGGVIGGALSFL